MCFRLEINAIRNILTKGVTVNGDGVVSMVTQSAELQKPHCVVGAILKANWNFLLNEFEK
ncbi:UNVERIFIED_CONTAM: hypothetical protein FKN15_032761 [Acipenser sinensis]